MYLEQRTELTSWQKPWLASSMIDACSCWVWNRWLELRGSVKNKLPYVPQFHHSPNNRPLLLPTADMVETHPWPSFRLILLFLPIVLFFLLFYYTSSALLYLPYCYCHLVLAISSTTHFFVTSVFPSRRLKWVPILHFVICKEILLYLGGWSHLSKSHIYFHSTLNL